MIAYQSAGQRYSDELQYIALAESIANGSGYELNGEPSAYRPPAWPTVLAIGLLIGIPVAYLPLVSGFLLIVAALATGRITVLLTGTNAGWLTCFIVLLYPINIYTASTVYPQTFATATISLIWLLALKSQRPSTFPLVIAMLLGLLSAALALAVPTLALASGLIIAWTLIQNGVAGIWRSAFTMGSALIPLLFWCVRNWLILGQPVLLSTSSGVNLLLGNNKNTTASNGLGADISEYRRAADELGLDELGRNEYFRASALTWISENPGAALSLFLRKLLNYFSAYNAPASEGRGSGLAAIVSWTSLAVLLGFLAIRIYLHFRGFSVLSSSEKIFLTIFVVHAPVMAAFFTRTRFRQPLDIVLLVEAGISLSLLVAYFLATTRRRKSASACDPR
ncbi:hypothetical protein [Rhodococcoides kroppenstedtii]|uniref:hypothetical protein n=1 Tax=Rhodococcoides kroppenstedtii TaxID=293050 RepID=UPI00363076E7